MSNKITKLLSQEFPIIKNVLLDRKEINDGLINFKFSIHVLKENLSKIVNISTLDNNEIEDSLFKYVKTEDFNYEKIRGEIKSICKFYYNERIQKFEIVVKFI